MIAHLDAVIGAAPAAWDDTVRRLDGSIFHSTVWATYQQPAGAPPIFLLGRDEHGEPAAVALAHRRGSRRPLLSLISRELVLSAHPATTNGAITNTFMARCEAFARARGCARITLESFASGASTFVPAQAGYDETERIEFRLDLTAELDALWRGVRKDQREKIKRLGREGVAIDVGISREDLLGLAGVRQATQEKRSAQGLGYELTSDPRFYDRLYEHLLKPGAARLFLARRHGETLGALLFATFNGRAYSMFSGSNDLGYRLSVQSGLFWSAVETFKAEGVRELNRGGIVASAEHEGDPLHGIYLFKLRLGTTPERCRSGRKVLSPFRDRLMRLQERRWA